MWCEIMEKNYKPGTDELNFLNRYFASIAV